MPAVAALIAIVAAAATAGAHNPALTVYDPVPLGEGLLVLGEEGTAALVSWDGETLWQRDTGDHLLGSPVVLGDVAASIAQDVATGALAVQAFDATGPTWRAPLEGAGLGTVLVVGHGRLAVFTDTGAVHLFDEAGERTGGFDVAAAPAALPIAHAGGWLVGGPAGALVSVDAAGETRERIQLSGRPSAITPLDEDGVVVAVRPQSLADDAPLLALDEDLSTRWARSVPGFQVGGAPAVHDGHTFVGTYRPAGAHLVAIDGSGEVDWDVALGNDTAAAVGLAGSVVTVVTNSGLQGYALDGEHQWTLPVRTRLASPTYHNGLAFATSANNSLVAVHPGTGELAWTWSDGVTSVPWTDEALARPPAPDAEGEAPAGAPGQALAALALVLAAVFVARRR